jgi:short-subunit dehydrogenase
MTGLFDGILRRWRRRWWRPDPAALAPFAGLRPAVVVTGGSEGIGLELARQFALNGHDVMLVARRLEPLEQAAARIRAETKVDAAVLSLDITSAGAVEAIDAALAAHRAYADVLVNNAGIGLSGLFHDHPPQDVQSLIDLNIVALTGLTRHYLPGMRARGRGGILNVGSLGGYIPGPYQAVYYATKAYVVSLTEAIAAETAGEGVRICALLPGPVDTKFHERMGAESALYRSFVPPASAQSVARAGYRGYQLGWRVMVPGLVNPFLALAMRILPHRIVIPIVGVLLKQRR